MNCTPSSLARAAKCFCMPTDRARAAWIYLLCQWAQKKIVSPFSYSPDTQNVSWTDKKGSFVGNLAYFKATADLASVITAQVTPAVTSVSNLSSLPALTSFTQVNGGITAIDASNCLKLTSLVVINSASLLTANVTNCPLLATMQFNSQKLTVVTGFSGCTHLNNVNLSNNKLPSVQVDTVLASLDSNGLNNGTLAINLQNPPAPPDTGPPNGITAKANLSGKGWTVTTD